MKICQFLYHAMPLNNGHLASGLGGPLFQKHPNPQMLPYTKKLDNTPMIEIEN
jgi:hypothetical protein